MALGDCRHQQPDPGMLEEPGQREDQQDDHDSTVKDGYLHIDAGNTPAATAKQFGKQLRFWTEQNVPQPIQDQQDPKGCHKQGHFGLTNQLAQNDPFHQQTDRCHAERRQDHCAPGRYA